MSAFLQSDKAYDSIACTLTSMLNSSDWRVKHLMDDVLTTLCGYLPPEDVPSYNRNEWKIARFCEALQHANVASVNYRYPDAATHWREAGTGEYKCVPYKGQLLNAIRLVKLLHSVDYQSCEPTDWRSQPIAKELEEITRALEAHIVRELPAYNDAAWSMR